MFTVRKYADKIGVSRSVVNEWLRQGMPYSINSTGHRVIDPAAAEKWLAERRKPKEETKATVRIPVASTASAFAAKVKPALRVAGHLATEVFGKIRRWLSKCKISGVKRELASAHMGRGFSLAIIPHDAAGKVVQFVFNRRVLKIVIILAILGGFAFFFLLGLAAAVPSLNNTIEHQNAIIQVYEQENEGLRAEREDLLEQIRQQELLIEALSYHKETDPKATLSSVQQENPNVPVPPETQKLTEYAGLFRVMLEETLEEVTEAEERVKEYQAEAEATPNIWPTDSHKITSGFGVRPAVFGSYMSRGVLVTHTFHAGIDIGADPGEPVYATAGGIVAFADNDGAWGNKVIIRHDDRYATVYAHLNCMHVKEGDTVTRGQLIGEIGATGKTTGAHLHYEIRLRGVSVNPARYLPEVPETGETGR
jgi:murein DD-endopeptidase MepM/ murein hydrolase activator NlpD